MDELQTLMGDAYKEGMTLEDVNAFFKGKKFADLSTGNYVDKNKYESTVNGLNKSLKEKEDLLQTKLTDEEKAQKAQVEKDAEIERLKQMLSANTIAGNKNTVTGVMTAARDTLGIGVEDAEFSKFVDNITTEDTAKSTEIANYFSKVVADAYEKGKQDATKDAMGNFGKGKGQSSTDGDDEIGKIGKRLAGQNKKNTKKEFNYFE